MTENISSNHLIFDPKIQINILRRFLHIISLLQNSESGVKWNRTTLSNILTLDEYHSNPDNDNPVSERMIDTCIKHLKEIGLDLEILNGNNNISLHTQFDHDNLTEILSLYLSFVAEDSGRTMIVQKIIEKDPDLCLWNLAVIHFAIIEKRVISIQYRNNMNMQKEFELLPHHIVLRNNKLYLIARKTDKTKPMLLLWQRIAQIQLSENKLPDEQAAEAKEILKNSLGSFIGEELAVCLRYSAAVEQRLEEMLHPLDCRISAISGDAVYVKEARFTLSDDLYLCKELFLFGNEVEIVSPAALRTKMKTMAGEITGLYA